MKPISCVPQSTMSAGRSGVFTLSMGQKDAKLYIGAMDPKAGACGSVFNIVEEDKLNHRIDVERGIMAEECSAIMKQFFVQLRKKKNK